MTCKNPREEYPLSSFGWLDTDAEQRRQMLELIDLFKESDTVDELGIGPIRDGLADLLFPGTSTLHTRLRYALFVPWLLQNTATRGGGRTQQKPPELKSQEIKLIDALLNGGEERGVIGRRAKRHLMRMPSEMYRSALRTWGIVQAANPTAYFDQEQTTRLS